MKLAQQIIDQRFEEELKNSISETHIKVPGIKRVSLVSYESHQWAIAHLQRDMQIINLQKMKIAKTVQAESNFFQFMNFIYFYSKGLLKRLCLFSLEEVEVKGFGLDKKYLTVRFLDVVGSTFFLFVMGSQQQDIITEYFDDREEAIAFAEKLISQGINDILLVDSNLKQTVKLSQRAKDKTLYHARQIGVLLPFCKSHKEGISDGKKCPYNCEQLFLNGKKLLLKRENTVQFVNLWDLKRPIHQVNGIETVKLAVIQRKLDDPRQEKLVFYLMDSNKNVSFVYKPKTKSPISEETEYQEDNQAVNFTSQIGRDEQNGLSQFYYVDADSKVHLLNRDVQLTKQIIAPSHIKNKLKIKSLSHQLFQDADKIIILHTDQDTLFYSKIQINQATPKPGDTQEFLRQVVDQTDEHVTLNSTYSSFAVSQSQIFSKWGNISRSKCIIIEQDGQYQTFPKDKDVQFQTKIGQNYLFVFLEDGNYRFALESKLPKNSNQSIFSRSYPSLKMKGHKFVIDKDPTNQRIELIFQNVVDQSTNYFAFVSKMDGNSWLNVAHTNWKMVQYDLGSVDVVSFARSSEREMIGNQYVTSYQVIIRQENTIEVREFLFFDEEDKKAKIMAQSILRINHLGAIQSIRAIPFYDQGESIQGTQLIINKMTTLTLCKTDYLKYENKLFKFGKTKEMTVVRLKDPQSQSQFTDDMISFWMTQIVKILDNMEPFDFMRYLQTDSVEYARQLYLSGYFKNQEALYGNSFFDFFLQLDPKFEHENINFDFNCCSSLEKAQLMGSPTVFDQLTKRVQTQGNANKMISMCLSSMQNFPEDFSLSQEILSANIPCSSSQQVEYLKPKSLSSVISKLSQRSEGEYKVQHFSYYFTYYNFGSILKNPKSKAFNDLQLAELMYGLQDEKLIDYLYQKAFWFHFVLAILYVIFFFVPFIIATATSVEKVKPYLISAIIMQSILMVLELLWISKIGIRRFFYVLQLVAFIVYFCTISTAFNFQKDPDSVALTVQTLLSFLAACLRLKRFATLNSTIGKLVLLIQATFFKLRPLLFIYLVMMVVFHQLFRFLQQDDADLVLNSFGSLTPPNPQLPVKGNDYLVWAAWILNIFIVVIFFLNFIIAVIQQEYEKFLANSKQLIYYEKLRLSHEFYILMGLFGKLDDYSILVLSIDENLTKESQDDVQYLTKYRKAIRMESKTQKYEDNSQNSYVQSQMDALIKDKEKMQQFMVKLSSRLSNIEQYLSSSQSVTNSRMTNIENLLQEINMRMERETSNFGDNFKETYATPSRNESRQSRNSVKFLDDSVNIQNDNVETFSPDRTKIPKATMASPPKKPRISISKLYSPAKQTPQKFQRKEPTPPKITKSTDKRIKVSEEEMDNFKKRRAMSRSLKVLAKQESNDDPLNQSINETMNTQKSQIVENPSEINIKPLNSGKRTFKQDKTYGQQSKESLTPVIQKSSASRKSQRTPNQKKFDNSIGKFGISLNETLDNRIKASIKQQKQINIQRRSYKQTVENIMRDGMKDVSPYQQETPSPYKKRSGTVMSSGENSVGKTQKWANLQFD